MAADDAPVPDTEVTFKVKTSGDGNHTVTMLESATVLDLKTKLSGGDFENISVDRMRLIYSGRVMKDPDTLSTYKIKAGNTVHMVKSAQSNASQNPASALPTAAGSTARAAPGVPTNMAAGTANNPLAGLTGARYAGHMGLPGAEMFGADGGMGAPPSEDAIATMLEDPNLQQTLNEALNNPQMIEMMIQQAPGLRDNPHAREMLQSPEFRRMMTNPEAIRQAAALRRMMGGGGGAGAFPAPGVTDTTPAGAAGSTPNANTPLHPFLAGAGGANPFAALFGPGMAGQTPAQTPPAPGSAGQGAPTPGSDAPANPANPFGSLFGPGAGTGGGAFPFPLPQGITPEMMAQARQMAESGQFNDLFGGQNPFAAFGGGGAASPPPPADNRPPEERYADQLRQLNDMGFYDFEQNVAALRRAGGSVQGAIEQLLR